MVKLALHEAQSIEPKGRRDNTRTPAETVPCGINSLISTIRGRENAVERSNIRLPYIKRTVRECGGRRNGYRGLN
jgi:hypothetical protein